MTVYNCFELLCAGFKTQDSGKSSYKPRAASGRQYQVFETLKKLRNAEKAENSKSKHRQKRIPLRPLSKKGGDKGENSIIPKIKLDKVNGKTYIVQ